MQSRKHSLTESIFSTMTGFSLSLVVQIYMFPLLGIHIDVITNVLIVVILTSLSIVRSYFVRRLFNWLNMHDKDVIEEIITFIKVVPSIFQNLTKRR